MSKVSNSKITKAQKSQVTAFLTENQNVRIFSFMEEGVTVAAKRIFPGSKNVLFAVSIMGEDETKFRPSVGAYYAMLRLLSGIGIQMPCEAGWDNVGRNARILADMIAY
jgi:hypothetical protein